MNILMLNTEGTGGGAALAAHRLATALSRMGHHVDLMVMRKPSDRAMVAPWSTCRKASNLMHRLHFLCERIAVWVSLGFRKKHLWEIDFCSSGMDITQTEAFQRADVVHLHWVNQGFLSLSAIRKIAESGKPMAWTLHDLWPVTAVCHYTRECRRFETDCSRCPLLPKLLPIDLTHYIYNKKRKIYSSGRISFVGCSKWIADEARRSMLTRESQVVSIPNPIDIELFSPGSQLEARQTLGINTDKRLLLWAAQKVTDPRKGMRFLVEAMEIFKKRYPEDFPKMAVAILGGKADEAARLIPAASIPIGFLYGESAVVNAYRAADAFILPSTEDNLPNTVMEAMACGIPSIGFSVGGVPEMITHGQCGYVARAFDTSDLADGIWQVLFSDQASEYGRMARKKVVEEYSEQRVAERFTELYKQMKG